MASEDQLNKLMDLAKKRNFEELEDQIQNLIEEKDTPPWLSYQIRFWYTKSDILAGAQFSLNKIFKPMVEIPKQRVTILKSAVCL